jgi:hypothetical protein
MGVTIHYEGKVASAEDVRRILSDAADYAREHGWPASVREHGLVLVPHAMCEPLELTFSGTDLAPSWVKTQFAGPDVHVAVVGLFRRLAPRFRELIVEDDGQYWETGSVDTLVDALDQVDRGLQAALGEPDSTGPYRLPSGRIVDVVTGSPPEGVPLIPFRPRKARSS